jgi:hypothetical protein
LSKQCIFHPFCEQYFFHYIIIFLSWKNLFAIVILPSIWDINNFQPMFVVECNHLFDNWIKSSPKLN